MNTQTIEVYFKNATISHRVAFVQGDTAGQIVCNVKDLEITENATVAVYMNKPSGAHIYNAGDINGQAVTVPVTSQMLAEVGNIECQMQVVDENGTSTSFPFMIIVKPNTVDHAAIESSNEFTALEKALAGSSNIADGSVTEQKLADNAVTNIKIARSAVNTFSLADLSVTTAKLDDKAVTSGKIEDAAVTNAKIGASAVTTSKIKNLNVSTAKLDDKAVTDAKLATDAVTTAKIKNGAVTGDKLGANAVTLEKLSTDLQGLFRYKKGDEVDLSGLEMSGRISGASTAVAVSFLMPKDMAGLTPTITQLAGGIRTSDGGYIDGKADEFDWIADKGYNVTWTTIADRYIRFVIRKASGKYITSSTNATATNNQPIAMYGGTLKIKFA